MGNLGVRERENHVVIVNGCRASSHVSVSRGPRSVCGGAKLLRAAKNAGATWCLLPEAARPRTCRFQR